MQPTKVDLIGVSLVGGIFASGVLYYAFRWVEGASPSEVRGLGALVFLLGFLVIGAVYAAGLYSLRCMPTNSERLARSQRLNTTFKKAVAVYGGCFLLYLFVVVMLVVLKL